ncbi:MAG: saccharopine dehydrogenase [Flavobacteriales bacterium]|nr:saccharopine dehydrogenase [Flavobacteriales bacterium]
MKTILLLGVGRSTHTLIKYLVNYANIANIKIVFADQYLNEFIQQYLENSNIEFMQLDINNDSLRRIQIAKSDLVISMMPPRFHLVVAKDCIRFRKNLITASYVSQEIRELHESAKKANIIILNEIGLDPGIDHISAMDVIDRLKDEGARISVFKSFCGGLIAPESDNNPWNYKFTWNPRNVVLAGKSGAVYLKNDNIKEFTYSQVFSNLEKVVVPKYGEFESYANRDSLHYQKKYNLTAATTIVRGTLRKVGFSNAWNVFVQLGMTSEDSTQEIISKTKFDNYIKELNNPDITEKMNYIDLFNPKHKNLIFASPADYLMQILQQKWSLEDSDKDMIVMQHKFEYYLGNQCKHLTLSMVVKGDDNIQTGMAKTVGLPVFFACKLILDEKISLKGVRIPIYKEIYKPILAELAQEGITFVKS